LGFLLEDERLPMAYHNSHLRTPVQTRNDAMSNQEIERRNEAIAFMLGWVKAKSFVSHWTSISTNERVELANEYWIENLGESLVYHVNGLNFHKSDILLEAAVHFIVNHHNVSVHRCLFPEGWEVQIKSNKDITRAVHYNKTGEKKFCPLAYLPSSSPREALFLALSDFSAQFLPTTIERILEQISVQEQITIHAGSFTAAIDSRCNDLGLEVYYDGDLVTIRRRR